ncbi:MAG TPA: hypothetical protein HA362_06885, partial [Nanoarchaeota archaeon]|nr:hypothetical protein [Nanoarchaeota archaeon]
GVAYTIEQTSGAYQFSSRQSGTLMVGTRTSNTLIMPDSGDEARILLASGETHESLPATVVFNSRGTGAAADAMADAETDAAERGSVTNTASEEAEAGCNDNDKDEDDDGIYTASHVSVVTTDGAETITTDYCAKRGDVTRLYEAVCTEDDVAAVRMVVCPEDKSCMEGACRVPGADVAGKYCLDSDIMTEDNAESLSTTVSTKGTTVGFYTATYATEDGGREFGAWSDYCRDDKTLVEYYCSAESRQGLFREIICSEGCEGGVCRIPPYCTDSDGGSFENVSGAVRGVTASGEYVLHEDTCADRNRVHEYSCESLNEVQGFKEENKACGEGKYCDEGKCVSGTQNCNQCDPLNNFSIREGTECNADGTPAEWDLKRCPAGQYCSAGDCAAEPKSTIAEVTAAFNSRKKWAVLLNETLGWIELAKGSRPISPVYAETMGRVADRLSSVQMIMLQRPISSGAGVRDGILGGPGSPY